MMRFDEAVVRFSQAASAVEQDHPNLREIVRGARESAQRIALRFRVDGDAQRADRELAGLLLDLAEAAERQNGVERNMLAESAGGPPSLETLERVRANNRFSMGISGVGDPVPDHTLAGDFLGGLASGAVRSVSVRYTNRVVQWILDTFGGPKIDIEVKQPIGTVTIDPWVGDPVKAATVLITGFVLTAVVAWKIVSYCSCRCERRAS